MKIRISSALGLCALGAFAVYAAPRTPQFTALDAGVVEGNNGIKNLVMPVYLSAPSTKTESVYYTTTSGTAIAGRDFNAVRGTLVFKPGVRRVDVVVPVRGDTIYEGNETLSLQLGKATAPVIRAKATGTIVDDERQPRLSVNNVTVVEGNARQTLASFTVSLSGQCQAAVTTKFATRDGSATAPSDYRAVQGTLVFAPGQTSKVVTVPVNGDTLFERDETFQLVLSNANVPYTRSSALGLIKNDDKAPPAPTPTPRPTSTSTPIPTATATTVPTSTPTPEPTATSTPEPTVTPEPTSTPTPEPTATFTPEPTVTPEPTSTPTPEPTFTPTPEPTFTPTPEPTYTPTPEPTFTPTPEPTVTPTPLPAQSGGILFYSITPPNSSQISRMNADGSGQGLIADSGTGAKYNANWSPDRRYIVFEMVDPATNQFQVCRMDSNGSHQVALATGRRPVWSPDGTHIAFTGTSNYAPNLNSSAPLIIMNTDGSNKKAVPLANITCRTPAWSPDGRQLAFFNGNALFKVNADGTNPTRLLTVASPNGNLSWSPDGKTLAFDSSNAGLGIYTLTTGGSAPVRITPTNTFCSNPVWSPDGTRILYSSLQPSNNYDVFSMKKDGSDVQQLTNALTNDYASDWKGDAGTAEPTIAPEPPPFVPPTASGPGKLLYSVTSVPSSNDPQKLMQVNDNGTNKTQIVLSSDFHLYSGAVWNADTSKIAFIASKANQPPNLWIANADGSNAHSVLISPNPNPAPNRLPSPSTRTNCDPTWSPDGQFLAYLAPYATDTTTNYLWIVGVDGSNPTRVTNFDVYGPVWNPDGTRIAFSSTRDDNTTWQLFTIKTDGTDLRRVFDRAMLSAPALYPDMHSDYPAWSPDGQRLAFINITNSSTSVWTVNASGSLPRRLAMATQGAAPFNRPAWSPDGTRIAFSLDQNSNRTDQIQVVNSNGSGYGIILNDGARNILSDWKLGTVPPPPAGSAPPASPARSGIISSAPSS